MNNLLFLDTETTGKDETARLVQLCWKLSGEVPPTVSYCKPPVPISFEAMATHHITEEIVKDAQPFAESPVKAALQTLLENHILVAHNAPFDISILEREGLKVPRFIDTLKVCQHIFDESQYKLQYLRYKYGLQVEGKAHDAEGDVLVLEGLFNYICNKLAETDSGNFEGCINKLIELSQQPVLLRRISFGKHRGTDFNKLPRDYMEWLRRQQDLDADMVYTLDYYLNPKSDESIVTAV